MNMPEPTAARMFIALSVIGLFGIITFALAAATLGTLNKRLDVVESKLSLPTSTIGPSVDTTCYVC